MDPIQTISFIPLDPIGKIALVILLLPLFSFILLFFFAKKIPGRGDWLATAIMGLCFLFSAYIFFQISGSQSHLARFPWFRLSSTGLDINFSISILIDKLSAMMLLIVTFISFLVHIYSIEYMKGKRNYSRYFPYLGIFTFSMLGIVISDNLLVTFMFWEMVGFSSYLLIGFWFDKETAVRASKKAFLFNRIGDVGFLIAIFFFYTQFGTFEITTIKNFLAEGHFYLGSDLHFWITIAGLGIFAGCIGKSAQFPLQVWLPDAMEGPTPVSALIHAATMVAAGIYLLAKVYFFLNEDVLTVIAFTGAITAFVGAVPAMFQNDIKKVLAYSTISQLGYMVMAMGVKAYDASLLHLATHAFFKAGLFLSAGAIIQSMHHIKHELLKKGHYQEFDSQDMRLMGGFRKNMPITFYVYLICTFSLIGIPFFSGYISKEAILSDTLIWALYKNEFIFYIIPLLSFLTVFITAFYMIRQLIIIFFGEFRLSKVFEDAAYFFEKTKDPSIKMKLPLIALAVLSIWIFFSLNPFAYLGAYAQIESFKTIVMFATLAALCLTAAGIFASYKIYSRKKDLYHPKPTPARSFIFHNFYLDQFYFKVLVVTGFKAAYIFKKIDKKLIDGLVHAFAVFNVVLAHFIAWVDRAIVDGVVNLSAYFSGKAGAMTRSLQMGRIQGYFIISLIALIFFIMWTII
jgi:NADH-quinone oxidoreductase subunit L